MLSEDFAKCRVGSNHQAEIPKLATMEERRQLMTSSHHGYDYPIAAGLPLPIIWAPQMEVDTKGKELQVQEANSKGKELQVQKMLDTEARVSSEDKQNQETSLCPPPAQGGITISGDHQDHLTVELPPCSPQEGLSFRSPMVEQGETKPLPYSPIVIWSDLEVELFLLGLYLFGKNFSMLSRFLGTKTVGNVLSYYYGQQFYNRDAYKRWARYRNAKSKRCTLGELIFKGPRRQELMSRLKYKIPTEDHGSLIAVFKSFSDNQTSFEDFVFHLKSVVGSHAFVDAVGIEKENDLTGFLMDHSRPNRPSLPIGMDYSSLSSGDIIKFITGGFKRSKINSNEIFWEAVWPRLLANGWSSEQPKDVRATRNYIVFLVPGIEGFSRSELTKGTHYFDSISEVLEKVAVEPSLLELENDEAENSSPPEKELYTTDVRMSQGSLLDVHQELPKFTIIDTSLIEDEEPYKVRELRNLPDDVNINFASSQHLPSMKNEGSSEEQDDSTRGLKTKDEKCRKFASSGNEQTSRHAFSYSKGPAAAPGDTFKTKKLESCSTKVMNPSKKVAKDSLTIAVPNEKKQDVVSKIHSKTTVGESKIAKERADGSAVKKSTRHGAPDVDKPSRSMKANEAPTISNSNKANVASEETTQRRPASPQPEPANPRRQGTRNRPPTARVLEAVALGFLGRMKRKCDPKKMADRLSQRARQV